MAAYHFYVFLFHGEGWPRVKMCQRDMDVRQCYASGKWMPASAALVHRKWMPARAALAGHGRPPVLH
jgi:hypothetical protein